MGMAAFKHINVTLWPRREYFEHYRTAVPCTYSLTVNIDISALRARRLKLYPTMIYAITTVVNRHEEFRMALDPDGRVGAFDEMHPCYTVFHRESELFSNIWTAYCPDYDTFCRMYASDLAQYGSVEGMTAKPDAPENTFPISMLPWARFTGFNLNLQNSYDYLLPIFTMGQFTEQRGKTLLPVSLQLHHAVCDGFHACRFLAELQADIDALARRK